MIFSGKYLLSRLWALTAVLCMVATLNSAFASSHSSLLVFEHQASGDTVLADGGWVSACEASMTVCTGHIDPGQPEDGAGAPGLSHHHHFNENHSGTVPDIDHSVKSPVTAMLAFLPEEAPRLGDRFPATIDQPPRVLSVI